jgi:N utilization substance protein A
MGKSESELLRLVEALHREKDIDKEIVFRGIEAALVSAARKHFGSEREVSVQIDRATGVVTASDENGEIHPAELGRIAAQTAKQVIIQKIREAERDALTLEYRGKMMTLVSGTVARFEGPNIIANVGRTEGFLPRSEQIPGESYHLGDRIRALVVDVRGEGSKVRVVLSRARPELVSRLFEIEVPEVAENVVEIKGVAREAGYRTKVAVISVDPRVDCVGACVGVQGSRIRNIVDELNGEKIDIVRWSAAPDALIMQALKPAEVLSISVEPQAKRARVVVPRDQLSLAIGKRGQNVRLVCKLTGWEIEIQPQHEPGAPAGTAAVPQEAALPEAAPGEPVATAPAPQAGPVAAAAQEGVPGEGVSPEVSSAETKDQESSGESSV